MCVTGLRLVGLERSAGRVVKKPPAARTLAGSFVCFDFSGELGERDLKR